MRLFHASLWLVFLMLSAITVAMLLAYNLGSTSQVVVEAQTRNTRVVSIEWQSTPAGHCPMPGQDSAKLVVTLQNTGSLNIPGVEVELSLPPGFEEINGTSRITYYKPGPIPPGSLFTLEFNLRVKPATPVGEHRAQLTLRAPGLFTETHDIVLRIGPSPKLEMGLDTLPLAGVEQGIVLKVLNKGTGEAKGLQVELIPPPGTTIEPRIISLGTLAPGQAEEIHASLDTRGIPSPTTLTLQARITGYDECKGVWEQTHQLPLPLTLPRADGLLISLAATPLKAGRDATLIITLTNTHPLAIENITLNPQLPPYITSPGSTFPLTIESLPPNSTSTLTLPLKLSSQAPPTGTLTLTATYKLGALTLTTTSGLPLDIEPYAGPLVAISLEPQTTPLRGGEAIVKVTVSNNGEETAKKLKLTLNTNTPAVIRGETVHDLGDLAPGEEKSLETRIILPSAMNTPLVIRASALYEDKWGTPYNAEQLLAIPLYTRTPGELTVTLDPPTLTAGQTIPVRARVANTGDQILENITITLSLPPTIRLAGVNTEWFIRQLPPGESAERTYHAYALPQAAGVETITVTLTYYKSGERREAVLPLGLPITHAQPPIIYVQTVNSTVTVAEENTMILTIGNKGGQTSYNTTLTLQSTTALLKPTTITIGDLPPNTQKTLKITITPAQPGPLPLQATITYQDQWGRTITQQASMGLRALPQATPAPPLLILETPPQPLQPGEHELTLRIKNPNTHPLESLRIDLTTPPSSPLTLEIPQAPLLIENLQPNEEASFTIRAVVQPVKIRASTPLTVTLSYWDPTIGPLSSSSQFAITIDPSPLPRAVITIEPTVVDAGKANTVSIRIQNKGPQQWEDAEVKLTPPPGAPLAIIGSTMHPLGTIAPGEERVLNATVYPPVNMGDTLGISVTLSFTAQGQPHTISDTLTLLVRKEPLLQATEVSIIPEEVLESQPFSLSITLSNTGQGTARNVFLEASLPQGIEALSSPRIFVGDIMAGTSSTLTLSLQPNPGAVGEKTIHVRITYSDNLGNQYEETLNVPILIKPGESQAPENTEQSAPSQGFPGMALSELVVTAIIVIVVALVLLRLRGRRGD